MSFQGTAVIELDLRIFVGEAVSQDGTNIRPIKTFVKN